MQRTWSTEWTNMKEANIQGRMVRNKAREIHYRVWITWKASFLFWGGHTFPKSSLFFEDLGKIFFFNTWTNLLYYRNRAVSSKKKKKKLEVIDLLIPQSRRPHQSVRNLFLIFPVFSWAVQFSQLFTFHSVTFPTPVKVEKSSCQVRPGEEGMWWSNCSIRVCMCISMCMLL